MNWDAIAFDWNQVRAFLAASEEGSLSAAARALHQTQPTLSRQVTSLERALGVTLFERGHRKLQLTAAGLELLEHVRVMAEAANRVSLAASGQSQAIEGRVCITATEMLATYYLPQVLRKLRSRRRASWSTWSPPTRFEISSGARQTSRSAMPNRCSPISWPVASATCGVACTRRGAC